MQWGAYLVPCYRSVPLSLKLEPWVTQDSLVDLVVTLGQTVCYMKAHIDCDGPKAKFNDVLFEPHHNMLSTLGVSTQKLLLHKQDNGTLLVPVQNYQGMAVHVVAGVLLGKIQQSSVSPSLSFHNQG